ncbi:SanA/YdcF family protein [Enterobacter cloacae subsp. dissolvens]
MRFINKITLSVLFLAVGCSAGYMMFANKRVGKTTNDLVWQTVDRIPFNSVGVVPGTRPGGTFFRNRISAAAELYQAGKVKWLIVSGDNRRVGYNEPQEMKKALVEKGIPESAIYCDYAGFTTLDTVVRAREVFGQTSITIVSQKFQNQRAIYLAKHYGISAIGLNAQDVPEEQQRLLGTVREYVARARAVLDATLVRRQPHFTGPKIVPGGVSMDNCPVD